MTGIPIVVALKQITESDGTTERHKFFAPIKTSMVVEEPEQECAEEAVVRAIEQDFKAEAELLLDRFEMSYLRQKTPKLGNAS